METKSSAETSLSAQKLRTEYLENPLGVDVKRPYLSWQVSSGERNISQSAYQIQVARTADQLATGEDLLWNSLKVFSSNTTSIQYGGPECGSTQRCFWRVRGWDGQDRSSEWMWPPPP